MKRISFLILAMALAAPGFAQFNAPTNNGNVIVASCGIAPTGWPTAGQRAPNTVDVNGNTCTTASVTLGDVTLNIGLVDNSAFTAGTTSVVPSGGFYHATRDTMTDNRAGAIAINANRAQLVQIEDSGKNAITSTGGALDVNIKTPSQVHVISDPTSVTAATLSAETTKVIGTVNVAAGQTIAVTQATGTNLHVVVDSGGGGGTQYDQGTVAVIGDTLTMAGVRYAASPALASGVADGDRAELIVNANNGLYISGLGTAGSAVGGVVTVQGAASMTPLDVNVLSGGGSLTAPADGTAFVATTTGALPAAGFYHATRDSLTDGTAGALALNVNRAVISQLEDTAKNAITSTSDGGSKRGLDVFLAGGSVVDAAEGLAPTSDPVPVACVYRTSLPTLDAGDVGYFACDVNGRIVIANPAQGSTTSGQLGPLVQGAVTTGDPTYVSGQTSPLSLTTTGKVRVDAGITADAAEGDAPTSNPIPVGCRYRTSLPTLNDGDMGYVACGDSAGRMATVVQSISAAIPDPCTTKAKSFFIVNTSSATTVEVANAVSSEFFYICGVNVVAGAAQGFLIAEDDTDGCGSITAGLFGGTTAATGWQFDANGGIALGNGMGAVMKTATAAHYLCILTSTTAQTSGTISYVSAP